MKKCIILSVIISMICSCTHKQTLPTQESDSMQIVEDTLWKTRGIQQAAALWTSEDGSNEDFEQLVAEYQAKSPEERLQLFVKLENMLETLMGADNQMIVDLTSPTILAGDDPTAVDYLMGAYDPLSHLSDDLFQNKIAFITILNFPNYSLQEKDSLGKQWTRMEWAYAKMGDMFTSRVPASVVQQMGNATAAADNYIADYNIIMGNLLTEDNRRLFPEDMVLLSHWNLRDELKSNYADVANAHEKQEMIYQVMQRIVTQEIPSCVINDKRFDWHPYSNTVGGHPTTDGPLVNPLLRAEGTTRYERILQVFHAFQAEDAYNPTMPTAIQRNFEGGMQVSDREIRELFTTLLESPEVGEVAAIIRQRLGRELRPYDIWYDGFKARANIAEDQLSLQTRKRYPNADAFHSDMPQLLKNLGFSTDWANYYRDHIVVEPARGSGHAWECMSRKNDPARLRTRIGASGMDYKGFNIAVHEFGHNVEQVTSLYLMDHYMLRGIPNTGFTEALAFLFQVRDLQLLGYSDYQANAEATLDNFWSMYEIMGVSLVDMQMWQWLYAHPTANAEALKQATLSIAQDIWNRYYEPILGEKDSPILAIYSHMVDAPMYLPNYPYGHLVHYQLEAHLSKCKSKEEFAKEIQRIYRLGNLTPNAWMQAAVGEPVSVAPVLKAVNAIINQ